MNTARDVALAIVAGAVIGYVALAIALHMVLKPFIHVAYLLAG